MIFQAEKRLKAAGFDPGPVDDILETQTQAALCRSILWQSNWLATDLAQWEHSCHQRKISGLIIKISMTYVSVEHRIASHGHLATLSA